MTVEFEYEKLKGSLQQVIGVSAGQMFGKACLKIEGKAFLAQHKDTIVFKLVDPDHAEAIALSGAILWDPSGKGRPMREWVALPVDEKEKFQGFSAAALHYVQSII